MPETDPRAAELPAIQRLPRRRHLSWCSAAVCVLAWALMATQPDVLAWLMIFPRWTWLLCGVSLLALGFVRPRWKLSLAVALLWATYTLVNVEESRSLVRGLGLSIRRVPPGESRVRVVTVNGGDAGSKAAHEAFALHPGLILFQESIQQPALQQIADQYWKQDAAVVWGPDTSIAAQGRLTLRRQGAKGNWIWATWHRDEGDIEVVSLRLTPVPLRFDCWNPDCWRAMTRLREAHRQEISEILKALWPLSDDRRVIIGGDFNAPAHDACLAELQRNYQDSFDQAGVGWGNSIVNGCPVHRIDQVWINYHFQAIDVRAVPSRHSDHALVVSELRTR